MKKALLLLCLAVGLMSCAKEILNTENDNTQKEGVPMSFNVTVLDTKAVKANWVNGDKIYVFFNGLETKYLLLTYDGSAWTNTSGGGDLLDTDFSGLDTKTLTAVHFPVAVDVTYADSKFTFTSDGKPVYNYYLYETGKIYTVDGTTVTATLSMGKPADMVQIHVAGIQESVGDYTFGCSKIRPVACASVSNTGDISEIVLQAGARVSGVADSDGGIFAGRLVYPGESKDYKFTVASNDNIYTLTRSGKALSAGKMYNFPSLSTTGGANWAVTDVSDLYVDLGLSVKWAKCNLGAENDYDYGDYFAWGETSGYNEGKTYFAWSTYVWGTDAHAITKYCCKSSYGKDGFTDELDTLLKEDDAAYVALGGKFRMPTSAEIDALLTLSKEWVTDYNGSGIPGVKFTGNGNTLFLPAAGRRIEADPDSKGFRGWYLSSSLSSNYPYCAWYLNFEHNNYLEETSFYRSDLDGRYLGKSVRPVSD